MFLARYISSALHQLALLKALLGLDFNWSYLFLNVYSCNFSFSSWLGAALFHFGKFPVCPVQEIECLKLKLVVLSSPNCEALVDGQLWSYHPINLYLESGNNNLYNETMWDAATYSAGNSIMKNDWGQKILNKTIFLYCINHFEQKICNRAFLPYS